MVGYLWLVSIGIFICFRLLVKKLLISLFKRGIGVKRVILLGSADLCGKVQGKITENDYLGLIVVGHVVQKITGYINMNGRGGEGKVHAGSIDTILERVRLARPHLVIFTNSIDDHPDFLNMVNFCQSHRIEVCFLSDIFIKCRKKLAIDSIYGMPVIKFSPIHLSGWESVFKRVFDLAAVIILVSILWPFFLLMAFLLKKETGGPLFFREKRAGLYGRNFRIVKFNTMRAVRNGNRAESVEGNIGRFMRHYSLDEFGQLMNVFKGDMSIVGPRPEKLDKVVRQNEWKRGRLRVKPGITGLAQIRGIRGDYDGLEKFHYDNEYIETISLIKDFNIILKSFPAVLKRKKTERIPSAGLLKTAEKR